MPFAVYPPIVSATPAVQKTDVAVTGSPGALFTIAGGRILLTSLFAEVTTVVGAVATTILLRSNPTVGQDTDLCTGGVITLAPASSLFGITGNVANALTVVLATQGALASMTVPLIIQPGTIDLIVSVGGTTGVCTWRATYIPLDGGATLLPT